MTQKYLRPVPVIIGIALMLLAGNVAFAQSPSSLNQTLINLQKQAAEQPFEKVYLHLDKPFYGAGDTIWFKAYIVVGERHHLSAISYVLNVDLLNEQNAVIKSIKLPVSSGLTRGNFALGDTLTEGNYRIRAYTNWMRNAGAEYFFDKTFPIVNAITNKVFTKTSYTYATNNGQQTVNALINYADADGKPYANSEVKYEVDLVTQKVASGKGVTNEKGDLRLMFSNPSPGLLTSGHLITAIKVTNQQIVTKSILIKAVSAKVDVQFLPEAGGLVNGITSKVAFKAVGADGLGADIKGTVTDGQNNVLATFSSAHLGMGIFTLTPEAGKNYVAHIVNPDGSQSSYDLPKAADKGYILTINNADTLNNVIVQVQGTENQSGGVVLVAQAGGEIFYEGKSKPGISGFNAIIPKSKFQSGIVQFTLFNDNGEPLNERLIFVQNTDKLTIAAGADQPNYAPRQKVKLNFNIKDKNNLPVQGNFSVAVTNESIVPVNEATENTIFANLLLTSDIKGYVEEPNYYFTNVNSKTAADLDVLMLTQGYHRYEWKQMISNTFPGPVYPPEKALTISGTVKTKGGKPVVNGKVTLLNVAQGVFLVDTVTDKIGRFAFTMVFADSNTFTVKALSAKGGENVSIEMDNTPPLNDKNKNYADVVTNAGFGVEAYFRNSKKKYDEEIKYGIGDHSIVLKQVDVITARKSARQIAEEKATAFSSNLNGPGEADQIITADDIDEIGGATLYDRLVGRLAGIEFRIDSSGQLQPFSMRTASQFNGTLQPMAVIVDGVFGRDVTLIPIAQIASVEVLRSVNYRAAYGSRASNGILLVTTKHGGQEDVNKSDVGTPGLINYKPKGYYKTKAFYSPQYEFADVTSKLIDLRTTIFWQPLVQTDKDGNASLEYFNADNKGYYRVVIEGIDYKSGNIGRFVYHYKVE